MLAAAAPKRVRFPAQAALSGLIAAMLCISCSGTKEPSGTAPDLPQISSVRKSHEWYYFRNDTFVQVDLPQRTPQTLERPWTEAVRISSAASVPLASLRPGEASAYALVNRMGIIAFTEDGGEVYNDRSVFPSVTADSLVFSGGIPVFYLYRSSFFNENIEEDAAPSASPAIRPFLVEFNPATHIFYPLVSYDNLKLSEEDEITGYFWDGKTWTCSSKRTTEHQVEFKYFLWEPQVELTELSPALSSDRYIFRDATEETFRSLNMPHLFNDAPAELKELVASIPSEFSFYVSWRDTSGTSPKNYYQPGNGSSGASINAKGLCAPAAGYTVIVFADGTTYLRRTQTGRIYAFRLPLLPAGYTYGEAALAGNSLYVAWEENNFYKTGRSGFIKIHLQDVISQVAD
ncbi:MAG TPA: hypothetical protein DDW78_10575 [Treponema sp.]|nr:hypothetical protein [Treponema sp.]